jgi:hypothetical protein
MEVLAKHPRSGLSHCPSGSAIECLPVATRHQAIAVVFDLVNPIGTRRRTLGSRRQAGLDEAERRGTLQLRLVISMCEFARNYGAKTVDLAVASSEHCLDCARYIWLAASSHMALCGEDCRYFPQ